MAKVFSVTKEWLSENYTRFNNQYFDGALPTPEFKLMRRRNTFGHASCMFRQGKACDYVLKMSTYYELTEQSLCNTLLHEMIHIADYFYYPDHFIAKQRWRRYDAHGPEFFLKEAERINKDGWNITRFKQESEMKHSKLSEKVKERQERPYILLCCYDKIYDQYCVVKTSQKLAFMYKDQILARSWGYSSYTFCGIFLTTLKTFRDTRCSTKKRYTVDKGFLYRLKKNSNTKQLA